MKLDLLKRKTNYDIVQEAVRRRVSDYPFEDVSGSALDARVARWMASHNFSTTHPFISGFVTNSHTFREYLRDIRLLINVSNEEILALEQDIKNFSKKLRHRINRTKKEVQLLESKTKELELQYYRNYDHVHHNAFVRHSDMGLNTKDSRGLIDPKTDNPLDVSNIMHIIPGVGATLPIMDRVNIPIVGATIVGEETDAGNTAARVAYNDPRYVYLPDKIFRYAIIRKEYDDDGIPYPYTPSYLTLLLDLSSFQSINWIKISTASASSLLISDISYTSEDGTYVSIPFTVNETISDNIYIFEPVRTRQFKIKLLQKASVSIIGDTQVERGNALLNDILEGMGWEYRFDTNEEYIEGSVYDFSIKDIATGYNRYNSLGVYRSQNVRVKNLSTVKILTDVEVIEPSEASGNNYLDYESFLEMYLHLDLEDERTKALKDIVPIPSEDEYQVELLTFSGDRAKLRFMPDVLWNLAVNRVLTVTVLTSPNIEVTLENPHGLSVDDPIGFFGPQDHPLNGRYTVKSIVDSTTFRMRVPNHSSLYAVTTNTTPRVYMYLDDAVTNDQTNPPLTIRKNDVDLVIGVDYKLNFSADNKWYNEFPRGEKLSKALEDPRAGKCYVKIADIEPEAKYVVEYKLYPHQYLGKTKMVKLKNKRLILDKKLRRNKGYVNVLAYMREAYNSSYLTPVLKSYSLMMRSF